MKYVLFLFLISMVFISDVNASADIVNRNCNPEMQACMGDVARKFGIKLSTERSIAQSRCSAIFNECRAANGGIQQSSGRVAQMYHPANPDFIECRKTISDPTSDAFRACMVARTRNARRTPPKPEAPINEGNPIELSEIVVMGRRLPCSKDHPHKCTTEQTCTANNGMWDGRACAAQPCPVGTTADENDPKYCKCDNDGPNESIERGSRQECPSACRAEDHKVFNRVARGCICASGYVDHQNLGLFCVSTAAPTPKVDECIRELQEKVTSCNTAATAAVAKCDPNQSGSGNDSLSALQNLLGGVNGNIQNRNAGTGATENCMTAAVASSSGYYALNELRGKCDGEINTCKTSCDDATTFINANKERFYQQCRKKAWDDHSCAAPTATQYRSLTEESFNVEFDGINRVPFDRQIQDMQKVVTDNNTKCDSGTAVANRDKMSDYMTDMNNAVKTANQCQCQLGSSSGDCANQVGPAECAVNPALPGCAQATVNCLSATDTSQKCVCFRNPNSNECKNIQQANNAGKINATDASAFAATGKTAAGTPVSTGGTGERPYEAGSLDEINATGDNLETAGADASGTTTADGSPFGAVAGGGGSAGGGSNGSADGTATAGALGEDESTGKRLGGFFETAKSALGNLFKKGKDDKSSADGVNSFGPNGANGNSLDGKKWRPRGMVRGLASDTEIAGKFEDIWKVMNRQYKIQDQRDSFLFGEKK